MTIPSLTIGEQELLAVEGNMVQRLRELWPTIKSDPSWIVTFLLKQYGGELEALKTMQRILADFSEQANSPKEVKLVETIVGQEENHVSMIEKLLRSRGEEPRLIIETKDLSGMNSWEMSCAATARAETHRLAEIRVVVEDPEVPSDIKVVFEQILADEQFHEKAFRSLAGEEAMSQTSECNNWQCLVSPGVLPAVNPESSDDT